MDLSIQKLSKAFNQKIIFRDLDFTVRSGAAFAIAGANGSGKSTLLKIISGGSLPTAGRIVYQVNGNTISEDQVFRYVHFVAPYNTVIEELTLRELFQLHHRLGLLRSHRTFEDWSIRLEYPFNPAQPIKMFSSGMKQRIKLGLSLLDDRSLILLDEPGSNLDLQGKAWLEKMIRQLSGHQTMIIATNDPVELGFCTERIDLGEPG